MEKLLATDDKKSNMSNQEPESQLITRLEVIEKQIQTLQSQLNPRLEAIEQQLQNFSNGSDLSERITNLEKKLVLVGDIYRYTKLEELLAAGNFREADWETIRIIQEISGKEDLESITPQDIKNFPCHELKVIDRLWLTYSKERFGFSIQANIYQSVGGSLETTIVQDKQVLIEFGERVGWREGKTWKKCDNLSYTLSDPVGCHPSRWWNSPFGSKMTNYFFARLMNCELSG